MKNAVPKPESENAGAAANDASLPSTHLILGQGQRFGWAGTLGGLGLLVLSLVFIFGGIEFGVGTPRRLGTGAFPVLAGAVLALISIAIILGDLKGASLAETPDWISFLAIGAALAIFAVSAERFGLIPAVFLATLTASLPDRSLSWIGKMLLGAGTAMGSWGLFIGVLDLPFRAIVGV